MKVINSQGPSGVAKALLKICQPPKHGEDKLDGIEWFVGRLTSSVALDNDSALKVLEAATLKRPKAILFLLKWFHIPPSIWADSDNKELLGKLLQCVAQWSLSAVKELTSLLPFSAEDVARGLTSVPSVMYLCSDAVRWLVGQYNLTASHIKANHNVLLFQFILSNKKGCAEWLIDSFGISLIDVMSMFILWGTSDKEKLLHLSTWRMILNKFPGLDCDRAWRMMPEVCNMPCIAEYTLKRYGVEQHGVTEQMLLKLILHRISDEFQLWCSDQRS
ncbi:hypothetical protein Pelo_411 [Pelomyxa schiedti]|nr:hypothetical protein Pelo_411 [Pelomyxa schiedti]